MSLFVVPIPIGITAPALLDSHNVAYALTCSPNSDGHYYGESAEWIGNNNPDIVGIQSNMVTPSSSSDVYVADANPWQNGYVGHALWLNTDASVPYWIEIGNSYGWNDNQNYFGSSSFIFYWADNRPNGGGYHIHWITGGLATVWGTAYQYGIIPIFAGSSEYEVYINNSSGTGNSLYTGFSIDDPTSVQSANTGLESTSCSSYTNSDYMSAYMENEEYSPSAGYSWLGWGSRQVILENSPAFALWPSGYEYSKLQYGES